MEYRTFQSVSVLGEEWLRAKRLPRRARRRAMRLAAKLDQAEETAEAREAEAALERWWQMRRMDELDAAKKSAA